MTAELSGAHIIADRTALALDIVECALDPTRHRQVAAAGITLMTDPYAHMILPSLIIVLTRAAVELAYVTGRTPADIVAGWRRTVAASIDEAELFMQRQAGGGEA